MIIIKGIIVVHYLPEVIATLVITTGEARVPGKPSRWLAVPGSSFPGGDKRRRTTRPTTSWRARVRKATTTRDSGTTGLVSWNDPDG